MGSAAGGVTVKEPSSETNIPGISLLALSLDVNRRVRRKLLHRVPWNLDLAEERGFKKDDIAVGLHDLSGHPVAVFQRDLIGPRFMAGNTYHGYDNEPIQQ